jgi:hypothetical protein
MSTLSSLVHLATHRSVSPAWHSAAGLVSQRSASQRVPAEHERSTARQQRKKPCDALSSPSLNPPCSCLPLDAQTASEPWSGSRDTACGSRECLKFSLKNKKKQVVLHTVGQSRLGKEGMTWNPDQIKIWEHEHKIELARNPESSNNRDTKSKQTYKQMDRNQMIQQVSLG